MRPLRQSHARDRAGHNSDSRHNYNRRAAGSISHRNATCRSPSSTVESSCHQKHTGLISHTARRQHGQLHLVTSDSATVAIPMQRKVYSDSLRYRAVVSGAFVNLDTMEIYTREQQISFPTPRRQAPRRNWALAAGVGATICRDGRIRPESSSESPIRSCNSELYNHPLCETYFCTNVKK